MRASVTITTTTMAAKAIEMLRDGQIDGLGTKSNLSDWSQRAKDNSFKQGASKAQSRHDLSADGAKADNKGDWSGDWEQPQKDHEGQGAKMKPTTADNTFTGKGGSKRDWQPPFYFAISFRGKTISTMA